MENQSKKTWCGSAKQISGTNQEGHKYSFFNIYFSPNDLQTLLSNTNEKGGVSITMQRKKEVDQYGKTHSLCINNFKPNTAQTSTASTKVSKPLSGKDKSALEAMDEVF